MNVVRWAGQTVGYAEPKWFGACRVCFDMILLGEAEVDDAHNLLGWRCQRERMLLVEHYGKEGVGICHGPIGQLHEQDAIAAAYLINGPEAVQAIITERQKAGARMFW